MTEWVEQRHQGQKRYKFIDGLLDGTRRAEHPDYEPDTGYKKARAESSGEQPSLL